MFLRNASSLTSCCDNVTTPNLPDTRKANLYSGYPERNLTKAIQPAAAHLESHELALPWAKPVHEGLCKGRCRHGLALDNVVVQQPLCNIHGPTLEDECACGATQGIKNMEQREFRNHVDGAPQTVLPTAPDTHRRHKCEGKLCPQGLWVQLEHHLSTVQLLHDMQQRRLTWALRGHFRELNFAWISGTWRSTQGKTEMLSDFKENVPACKVRFLIILIGPSTSSACAEQC